MESLVGLGALKTCPPSSMSSRRIMTTSVSVGCLWRSTDFTAMGSWEMFVIPQKLFFFTGTRLLGVNTPVPDLPSIFTAPAPVRYFFLPSFPLHASHMTALSGDRDIRGPHGISRYNGFECPSPPSIVIRYSKLYQIGLESHYRDYSLN